MLGVTYVISESDRQPSRTPLHLFTSRHLLTTIVQPNTTELPCNEADILLAILAINSRQIRTARQAAATYNVPKSTLYDRLARKPSRSNC